jgi:hypothetical protein
MGRVYSAVFEGVAVAEEQDLFEMLCGSAVVACVHEIHITQDDSEVSLQNPVRLRRIPATVTSGTGGASVTPRRMMPGDAASVCTVERNNTTIATSSGTVEIMRRIAENALNGWHWVFTPETRIWLPPSGVFCVTIADPGSLTMSGELVFEEFG